MTRRTRFISGPCILLTALLLAGCAVGPDFHRPVTHPPARYTGQAMPSVTAASPAADGGAQRLVAGGDVPGAWWQLFGSPVLSGLVVQAVRDNPTLEAARDSLTQARELVLQQKGTLFPSVSGVFSRTRELAPESYEYGRGYPGYLLSAVDAQLNLSYTFDVWGGLRRAVEQQQAKADYARFQLEAAELSLTAGVANSVILAASLLGQIAVQQQLIGFEQKQLDTVRQQFVIGAATGTDVATQEAQVVQARTVLVPLETQAVQARDQIAAYLGRAPSELSLPALTLDQLTLPDTVPVSIPSALLEQRPDIRSAEATLHAQTAAVGVAVSQRLPQVTLTASVGSEAGDVHQLFSPTNGLWSLVNQAAGPVFDAGQLLHAQRAQQAAMRQARAQWVATVVGAFQNVADLLTALQNDAVDLRYANEAATAGQRSLSLASLQYKLGGVSYLSVLTAQQTYQDAVLTLIRARAARLADTVNLIQALGGGWWHRDDLPSPPPGLLSSPLP